MCPSDGAVRLSRRSLLAAGTGLGLTALARPGMAFAEATGEAPAAPAADWATFRNGPQLLGLAGAPLPEPLELLWQVPTPDGMIGTPAIVAGRVYAGTLSGELLCLDLRSGEVVWRHRSIESLDPNEFAPGFVGPVAVAGDRVFGGDDQGTFHAVERDSGRQAWTFETKGEIIGGPTPWEDALLFGSHDGKLYCLAQADGALRWEFATQGPVNAAPAIDEGLTFITGCDKPVMRVVNVADGRQHSEIPLEGLLIASPAVANGVLYFGTDGGFVVALDWRTGKQVWTYSVPNRAQQIQSSPALTEDLVLIGSRDKHLHAIDRKTGQARWTLPTRGKIDASPVVAGRRVYVGSADKFLYAANVADGQDVWKFSVGQSIAGSAAIAQGRLVVGSETADGRILCFGARAS